MRDEALKIQWARDDRHKSPPFHMIHWKRALKYGDVSVTDINHQQHLTRNDKEAVEQQSEED